MNAFQSAFQVKIKVIAKIIKSLDSELVLCTRKITFPSQHCINMHFPKLIRIWHSLQSIVLYLIPSTFIPALPYIG